MNKDIKKYFKECKYLFASYGKKEKKYLESIKNNLLYEDNTITYVEIINRLGTPKDVIIDYYEQKDSYELIKKARAIKLLRRYIIIFLIILSIFLAYKSYIYQKTYDEVRDSNNGYFEEVIE
jgi:hypothetical protein